MQYAIAALAFAATVVNAIPALAPAPESSAAEATVTASATASATAYSSASESEILVTSIVYTSSEVTVISCDTTVTYVIDLISHLSNPCLTFS